MMVEKITGRWRRVGLSVIAIGFLLLFFAPTFLGSRAVRDWILTRVLQPQGIEASIDGVVIGWFRPTRVRGITLGPVGKPPLLKAGEIISSQSLFKALSSRHDLGVLTVVDTEIHIHLEEDSSNLDFPRAEEWIDATENGSPKSNSSSRLDFGVINASLFIQAPSMQEEALVFSQSRLRGQIVQEPDARILRISPGVVVRNAKVTPELCTGGLKYVLPILAEATWSEGEFSIELEECEIDLDQPQDSHIRGTLTVHGIQAGLKDDAWVDITKQVAQLLGRQPFESVVLADDSRIAFEVIDGKVLHEGVEFGLPKVSPDLVVRTRGSVGFDETLDIEIDIPTPLHLLTDGPVARALGGNQLTLTAVGTLKDPKVEMQNEDFATDLLMGIAAELATEEDPLESLRDGFRKALGRDDDNEEGTPIFDRMRDRRQQGGGLLRRLFRGDP